MKLQSKFTLYLTLIFLIISSLIFYLSYRHEREEAKDQAYEICEKLLAEVEATRAYVREVLRPVMFDLAGGRFIPEAMSTSYAARRQTEIFLRKYPDYYIKFASLNPRNPINLATDLEKEVIEYFRANPGAERWRGMNEKNGMEYLTVAAPYRFTKDCLRCHGNPEDAPPGLIELYGDKNGFGVKEGDVTINSIGVPIRVTYSQVWRQSLYGLLPIVALLGIMFVVTSGLFNRLVSHPVWKLKEGVESIAQGSYKVRVESTGSREINDLADAYNRMAESLEENIAGKNRAEEDRERINKELSVLYSISSAMSRTIELKELLDIILETVTRIEMFDTQKKGGIFIIENDRMELISHLGHSGEFLALHNNMRIGDCLCGLAAVTGEIIISKNSYLDGRHTIRYPEMSPHGHIIIPLKAKDRVTGVLYLYLPADFEIAESKLKLLETISGQLGVAIENARLYEETKRFSLHDPLTGLANRRYVDIVLERNFAAAKRDKKPFSIIMADIDHFKKYNDTHGHIAGDRILVSVARSLEKEAREVDLISRYGGEEFLILLSETDIARARSVAEHKRKAVEEAAGITISLGVASYNDKITKPEELIKNADEALYQAKQKGRNRVEVFG